MITIYCDFQCTQQVQADEFIQVVKQIQDYIPLRQFLRRALDDGDNNYIIYVQSRLLAQWLDDLRDYSPQIIHWEEINLREQFLQKFDFPLPSELDESAIQDLQLLSLAIPDIRTATDPIGWLLGELIDPVWRTTKLYSGHLADLSAWAVVSEQIPFSLLPLVKVRLNQWIKADNRYRIFLQYTEKDSWRNVGEAVLLRWALQFYPTTFHLREELDSVIAEDCSSHAQLCCNLLKNYDSELKQYWGAWLAAKPTKQQVEEAIKTMSGLVDCELRAIEQWAMQNASELTPTFVDIYRDKFSFLPQFNSVFKKIESLISPPPPQIPDVSWSTEQWLNWATDEYMPYFAWVIRNRQPRDFQIQLANSFADWMVNIYPQLVLTNAPLVTSQLSRIQNLLDSQQADVILWFIIDGLTWWQGKKLASICADSGIGVTEIRPTLSALPSVTSISKRAIVQGYLDRATTTQSIAQLLRTRLNNEKTNIYVYTQYQELEIAIGTITDNSKPSVYALLYNALDEQNHKSSGFIDDESVDGHLQLITRLTNQSFQHCLQQGLKTVALVISDHGSTLLPPLCSVEKLPLFASEFNDDDNLEYETLSSKKNNYQGTRSCAVNKILASDEIRNLEQNWYYLAKDLYTLPQDFIIPKGYAAVNRRPGGWTHGGATPEETVVAFIELNPAPIQITPPTIKIEGYLTPSQPSILQVAIENSNSVALRNVRLAISGTQASLTWSAISAFSKSSVEDFNGSPANSRGKTQTIEWLISCEAGGRNWQFIGQVEISIRRFQVSLVDELFDM
jgi:hypothetical protein